jgi:hypothetical protein
VSCRDCTSGLFSSGQGDRIYQYQFHSFTFRLQWCNCLSLQFNRRRMLTLKILCWHASGESTCSTCAGESCPAGENLIGCGGAAGGSCSASPLNSRRQSSGMESLSSSMSKRESSSCPFASSHASVSAYAPGQSAVFQLALNLI